ncbi:MAG TPA: PIG-L family deacetylase [Acidimicrobiales bacterium]|nr:PIG-L family deacetylase [Acidimicrobiales bacterium]
MATAVFFHAHPDDETISTGGTMAKMAAQGHRVVVVTATGGELGEVPDGLLGPGETLAERRAREVAEACSILGVSRHVFLGYRDSGMDGEPSNDDPACFWRADVDEAATRLRAILDEERATVLTAYDEHGNYGHPDHIQVHRVGLRAAALAGTGHVFLATINRDHFLSLIQSAEDFGVAIDDDQRESINDLGVRATKITTAVDVRRFLTSKRRAMEAHASQIQETSFFLSMPPAAFEAAWGTEWYIRLGTEAGAAVESALIDDHADDGF